MALWCLGLSTQRQRGVQSLGAEESHVYFQQREPGQQPIVWQLGWGRMETSRLGLSMLPSPPEITLYWWVPFLWGSLNCTVAWDLVSKSVPWQGGSALWHEQHLAGGFPSAPIILQDWGGGQPLFLLRKLPATSRLTRDFSREVNCGGFSRCSLGDGEALGPVGHHWFEIPNIPSGLVAVTLPVALLSAPKTCFLSETAALIQASWVLSSAWVFARVHNLEVVLGLRLLPVIRLFRVVPESFLSLLPYKEKENG